MKTFLTYLLVFWLGSAAGLSQQSPETRVIASTKDWSITAQQFEQFLELLPDETHLHFSTERREFLDQLVRLWVMAAEGRAQGLDKTAKFKATVEFYTNNMLAGELHKQQVTGSVTATDEAVRNFYEANKLDFTKIRLSHILILDADSAEVRDKQIPGALPTAEAKSKIEEAQVKLRNGASFAELAKEYSQDPASAATGGDVGYISKGQMAAEVEAAAFALKQGTFSNIVESPFGFHLLYVSDVKIAPLAEVSAQIRQKLDVDQFSGQVEAKVKAAGVNIDESFFQK